MIAETAFANASRYAQKWRLAAVLLGTYFVVYVLSSFFLPCIDSTPSGHFSRARRAIFGGVWLWPAVYIIALLSAVLSGMPALALFFTPIVVTLQSIVGAYLLRKGEVDPLFRRHRDMFYLISVVLLISLLSPTLEAIGGRHHVNANQFQMWGQIYVGSIFCFLIITPFILRWFTKPRLKRTPLELLETVSIFAILLGLDYTIFIQGIGTLFGVPLIYVLLIPLFLISLRLRPRFVTLGARYHIDLRYRERANECRHGFAQRALVPNGIAAYRTRGDLLHNRFA